MEIVNTRSALRETYTIGHVTVDGKKFCDVVEDKDRGLRQDMPLAEIKRRKVYGETAIPIGRYRVRMDLPSPKYVQKAKTDTYYRFCCNNMPRLEKVPGYDGILFHPGSSAKDTLGCQVVGDNTIVGQVTNSRTRFRQIWQMMYDAYRRGEEIWYTIQYKR